MHELLSCAWRMRSTFAAWAVGMLLGLTTANAELADHQRIESLFAILEAQPGAAPLPPPSSIIAPQAPDVSPSALPVDGSDIPEVPFAEILIDRESCPRDIDGFKNAVNDIVRGVKEDEEILVQISGRFDSLRDATLEAAIQGSSKCSDRDRWEYRELLVTLKDLDIEPLLAAADNLMGCAQKAVTGTKRQMDEIPESALRDDQNRRLNLSMRHRQLADLDEAVTRATQNLGSLELKRGRLERGTMEFESACEALDDFSSEIVYE